MEKSSFFTSLNGDRRYKATDFAEYFKTFIGNGVFPNPSTNLQVIANGDMTLTLSPGFAWINGYMYSNTDNLTLTVDHADSALKRIDRVVIRCDFIGREIKAYVKKGVFASTPAVPSLECSVNAYELSVANILVENGAISITQSKITDTRLDSQVCGIVTQTVNEIDTTTLYNQLEVWKNEEIASFNAWKNGEVESFNNWRTGQESTQSTWFNSTTTGLLIDFNTWFNNVKGILGEDIAGNLLNKINSLESIVSNLELTSGKIIRPDGSNVEETLESNKTSISEQRKEIDSLKQSVSDGKSVVASAITDKGVPTLATDTFQKMATNISNIKSSPTGWDTESVGEVFGSGIVENDAVVWQKYGDWENGIELLINQPNLITGSTVIDSGFSPSGEHFVITTNSAPYIHIYKRNGDTYTKLPTPNIVSSVIEYSKIKWSPSGNYLAISRWSGPSFLIYKRDGDVFTSIPIPTLSVGTICEISFSPDERYALAAHYKGYSGYIYATLLEVSPTALTAIPNADLGMSLSDDAMFCSWSPDGNYVVMGYANLTQIDIYKYNNGNKPFFTKHKTITRPNTAWNRKISWSMDSKSFVVSCVYSPGIVYFNTDGGYLTSPASIGESIYNSWSADGSYLAVATKYSPYITILKKYGDTLQTMTQPSQLPTSSLVGCHMDPLSKHLVCTFPTGNSVKVYNTSVKNIVSKYSLANIPLIGLANRKIGYAMESKNIGEQINVNLFPKLNTL